MQGRALYSNYFIHFLLCFSMSSEQMSPCLTHVLRIQILLGSDNSVPVSLTHAREEGDGFEPGPVLSSDIDSTNIVYT